MLKVLQAKAQEEIRNMFLEVPGNWRKGDACGRKVCPALVQKAEFISSNLGYLAEEIAKQTLKVEIC